MACNVLQRHNDNFSSGDNYIIITINIKVNDCMRAYVYLAGWVSRYTTHYIQKYLRGNNGFWCRYRTQWQWYNWWRFMCVYYSCRRSMFILLFSFSYHQFTYTGDYLHLELKTPSFILIKIDLTRCIARCLRLINIGIAYLYYFRFHFEPFQKQTTGTLVP